MDIIALLISGVVYYLMEIVLFIPRMVFTMVYTVPLITAKETISFKYEAIFYLLSYSESFLAGGCVGLFLRWSYRKYFIPPPPETNNEPRDMC